MRAARQARKAKAKIREKPTGYNTYRFIDKDPIIDVMRTAIADTRTSYAEIERSSGVTGQTLRNWFVGGTKRPQFATVQAVAKSLGKELKLVDAAGRSRMH